MVADTPTLHALACHASGCEGNTYITHKIKQQESDFNWYLGLCECPMF